MLGLKHNIAEKGQSMKLRRLIRTVLVLGVLFSTFALFQNPAKAMTVGGGFSTTPNCTAFVETSGTATWDRNNSGSGLELYYYQAVDGAGTVLVRYPSSGTYSAPLGTTSYGNPSFTFAYTTLPAYNPITVQWISVAGNGFAQQTVYSNTGTCPGLPNYVAPAGVFQGPAIPGGFVLRTITCDVAVFNTPGGTPLATGEKIKAGQTWYVNPTPVKVSNNALYPQWTEIFNSGQSNGFIPTSCVGGKPAGYTGD